MENESTMPKFIRTEVAPARWHYSGQHGPLHFPEENKNPIYWLDTLLGGNGFQLLDGSPLTVLVTGPPGSGKTTLALEICHRLSRRQHTIFFMTREGSANAVKNKAVGHGWEQAEDIFLTTDSPLETKPIKGKTAILTLQDVDTLAGPSENENRSGQSEPQKVKNRRGWRKWLEGIIPILAELIKILEPRYKGIVEKVEKAAKTASTEEDSGAPCQDGSNHSSQGEMSPYEDVDFVVLDSFVPEEDKLVELKKLVEPSPKHPKIILFVIDSSAKEESIRAWEHRCDTVIDLNYYEEPSSNYMIRTIQVVKARYQNHIWGKHQLKIYKKPDPGETSHPYLQTEGGIFIYPSIHFFLSRYKGKRTFRRSDQKVPTPLTQLNNLLDGGIPLGRCTAIIGSRGTHKSHLGYYHLLNAIRGFYFQDSAPKGYQTKNKQGRIKEHGLVISLRDDEGLAKEAMVGLLETMQDTRTRQDTRTWAEGTYDDLIETGQLEVLYFQPGYIRPEEFYHRVLMSILRIKNEDNARLTVLFNSLDQLSARFPLCAREGIFVPGLVETFSAEKITSIFVGVEEEGEPEGPFGLLTMADLILKTRPKSLTVKEYISYLQKAKHIDVPCDKVDEINAKMGSDSKLTSVSLYVERFAGGERAGDGGLLELVQRSVLQGFYREGHTALAFAPFGDSHNL